MNILIVGNGFDLSHYLPTKYDHFMVAMDAIENWDESQGDMSFDDLFGSLYEKEKYFFGYTKAMYKTDDILIKTKEIIALKERLLSNNWYRYFKYYKSNTQTWIDLEQKIKDGLELCSNFFDIIQKKINENSKINYIYKRLDERAEPNMVQLHSKDIHVLYLLKLLVLKKRISSSPVSIWEDIEIPKGNKYTLQEDDRNIINNDFIYENASYTNYDYQKALSYLYSQLADFINIFNDYLVYVVDNLVSFSELKSLDSKPNFVYSFNYTHTFQREYSKNIDVQHIHGECGQQTNNLVLGISDLTTNILKKWKSYGFTKYHQKLLKETKYHFLDENIDIKSIQKFWSTRDLTVFPIERIETMEQRVNIYIWGHSLDISDDNYIQEIFNFNSVHDENVRVIIYYFSSQAQFELLANLIHILKKEKVEKWMKKGWLKFERNPDIAKLNNIKPVELLKFEEA